jgi:dTDP-4-amino-4,6-dideoxygalactose transaminase
MSLGRRVDMSEREVAFSRPELSYEARAAAARALSSTWLTTGPECAAFEDEFAAWVRAEHAVSVSSCTAALELSLLALRLPENAKVLVPAITFCGVVGAIIHAGLVPVLVDADLETGTVSPATCAAAARACGGADAMVVLHFAGYPVDVRELAEAAGLPLRRVVEDAAHALGTWVGDQQVGSISPATCFSFYATKNLPIGEGGMVTTDDPELADWLRQARLHGMSRDSWRRYLPGGSWRYTVEDVGLKANMSDLQAAIGRGQLRRLDVWQHRRAELAERYEAALACVPGLQIPVPPRHGVHAWHLYVVRIREGFGTSRDEVVSSLASRGVSTSVHFIPIHHLPWFQARCLTPTPLTGADQVFTELLSLPLYPALTDDEIDVVCEGLVACRAVELHQPEVIR